jgi:hypothetical protein
MVAVIVTVVVVWLWACRFAGLGEDETVACVYLGVCFGLPALAVAPALFVLSMKAFPNDPPPTESRSTGWPQFTIGCLMSVIAISAVVLALIWFG